MSKLCACSKRLKIPGKSFGDLLFAIFGRPPADPFCEGVGKYERIMIADFLRDRFDGKRRRGEQFCRAPHAQIGDLMHGTAPELAVTEAAKVFVAVAGFARESSEGPILLKVPGDAFPEQAQSRCRGMLHET